MYITDENYLPVSKERNHYATPGQCYMLYCGYTDSTYTYNPKPTTAAFLGQSAPLYIVTERLGYGKHYY